ncbi:OLC1v1028665C1 [Oldenlandia corymbosa var. corymbosa]|uniref:Mannosyl-oligosaccharide glucosidase n=1 Tax=Oldenlandia corymbosa var. corymbosa TaxID=529605 RepID=A0AAV1CC96_OLDCO|nr:OLC1v1028665C1 [Oldenlandia corymbosa var. corymbosa]
MAGRRNSTRSRIKPNENDVDSGDDRSVGNARPKGRRRSQTGVDQSLISIMNVNIKTLLGLGILASFVAVFIIFQLVNTAEEPEKKPRVVTPFPAPKLMDLPMFQGDHRESLYWGTYRPTMYFGIRARTPLSLVAGLMWIGVTNGRYSMRHVCQNSDELKKYGWTEHNGRDYGRQILVDHEMTLTTNFLKSKERGSSYGGDWAVRIGVEDENSELDKETSKAVHLFFYMADETGNALNLGGAVDVDDDSVLVSGYRSDVGNWQLHLKSEDEYEFHHAGFRTPFVHNLSDLVQADLGTQARKTGRLQLSDTSTDSSNIFVFQLTARIPFKAEFIFLSGTLAQKERAMSLSGTSLTNRLTEKQKDYADKFQRSFDLPDELDSESVTVGKAALGNLLGGIGYFYGQSKISLPNHYGKDGDKFISYWPAELYTAVPSRPFFPRGFLWDEGFHQLIIWRWDIRICLDILGHWLDLMNIDGWIPREQILGAEALSKVPEEFVLQHPTNGNPPTLFLVLRELICSMKTNKFTAAESDEILLFLDRAFVRLEAWFKWFNTTQSGKAVSSYFWHGRDNTTARELNPKSLSSGLDDYPRASHPSEDERHLDLRCWMHLAADCLHSIIQLLGKEDEHGKEYMSTASLLSDFELLNQMHFDADYGAYFDFGNHTEKVRLNWQIVEGVNNHPPSQKLSREVLEKPVLRLVPHFGYVSLFPLMGRLIPPGSSILEKQLDLISNRSTLWTNFGLRSLSKTSSIYMKRNTEHDPPYWRGPIWMNMNYMILSALHHYSREDGPYRERAETIYKDLRHNLVRNVVNNYQKTGYFWEQFDQQKGKGKGAHLFTGWTSLVVLIMAEKYHEC